MPNRGGIKYEAGCYDAVPAGTYVVEYYCDEGPVWIRRWGRHSTILLFTIINGDYAGTLLPWWVTVEKSTRGTYRFPNMGNYMKLLRALGLKPKRRDRCQPGHVFKGLTLLAEVNFVTKNMREESVPEEATYSKITKLSPIGQVESLEHPP